MAQKIKGRRKVVVEAKKQIDLLVSRIEGLIKGPSQNISFI